MAKTLWVNAFTGERVDAATLLDLRARARRAYQANTHIFEDEVDALSALGVVPGCTLDAGKASLAA